MSKCYVSTHSLTHSPFHPASTECSPPCPELPLHCCPEAGPAEGSQCSPDSTSCPPYTECTHMLRGSRRTWNPSQGVWFPRSRLLPVQGTHPCSDSLGTGSLTPPGPREPHFPLPLATVTHGCKSPYILFGVRQ